MRIFVSEYLTSGAWNEPEVPASLLTEGGAMLQAIASDFAKIDNCQVATTWDLRLGPCPISPSQGTGVEVQSVSGPIEEAAAFQDQCQRADAVLVIAPEFQNLLAQRCQVVANLATESLNASVDAIEICSDKFALSKALESHRIPTIPTRMVSNPKTVPRQELTFPLVIKPRDGAGSQSNYLIQDLKEWNHFIAETTESGLQATDNEWVIQPYVAGRTLSIAAMVGDLKWTGDPELEVFPLAEQRLTNDGRFHYLGGRIPETIHLQHLASQRVKEIVGVLPGFRGYIGFDLLAPFNNRDEILIVEINPRLTTSYLGYRELADQNLAEFLLPSRDTRGPLRWKPQVVRFTAEGKVSLSERLP